jgi:acyl-homoserine-lactone acylase
MRTSNIRFLALVGLCAASLQAATGVDESRLAKQAQNVTIIRDDWGIAHVFGKSDQFTPRPKTISIAWR